jgi:diguanylate cyclase (GGDEF)-like protein/putative nucleotidyltransferase with HDIG domain
MDLCERYSRLSLRWRILVPFLAVSLAVSFTGTWFLGRSLQQQVYNQADKEVQQEAALAALFIEREKSHILSQLVIAVEEGKWLTANGGDFTEAIAQVDVGSVMQMLGVFGESVVDADFVKIVDPEGETILNLNSDLLLGRTIDDKALIERALAETNCGDIITTTDGRSVYLAAAATLPSLGSLGGIIILGTKINEDLLREMGLSNRTLIAYTDEGIAASSNSSYRNESWAEALATTGSGHLTVEDKEYVMASAPVNVDDQPSAVRVATVMPLEHLAGEAADDWTRTWLIFAAGAAVLVLAGFVVARRLVHPIRQLTAATGQLKNGDFDTRIEVGRDDEIGLLAQAFNTMGEELKARDERLAETFNEVKRLSETDALTGLLNHRMINERLALEVARAQRYGSRFGVMIIDLDNFKLLNDTHGHPTGDEALRRFARLLLDRTREADAVGRHGGDEFMIVMPECGPAELAGAAEKLQSALATTAFEAPDGSVVPLKMSLGIACYPEDGHDINTLIALADANLYLSKSRGGGTITGAQIDDLTAEDATVFGMLGSLVTIVDNKDRYTRHHSEEVTELALSLGEKLGLSDESQRVLRVAGLLHDIGKIGVPDRILRKPGRITEEEFEVIKQHTLLGDAIIAAIPDLAEIRAAVVAHHERYDGNGYPSHLCGEAIPLLGRILAVADAYSAMMTDRPYRKALGEERAIAELTAGKGTQFDPACVDAFLTMLEDIHKTLGAKKAVVADPR